MSILKARRITQHGQRQTILPQKNDPTPSWQQSDEYGSLHCRRQALYPEIFFLFAFEKQPSRESGNTGKRYSSITSTIPSDILYVGTASTFPHLRHLASVPTNI
jgi:hypothetical protein